MEPYVEMWLTRLSRPSAARAPRWLEKWENTPLNHHYLTRGARTQQEDLLLEEGQEDEMRAQVHKGPGGPQPRLGRLLRERPSFFRSPQRSQRSGCGKVHLTLPLLWCSACRSSLVILKAEELNKIQDTVKANKSLITFKSQNLYFKSYQWYPMSRPHSRSQINLDFSELNK